MTSERDYFKAEIIRRVW